MSFKTLDPYVSTINAPTVSAANGYVYVAGGVVTTSLASITSEIRSAKFHADGTLGPWNLVGTLTVGVGLHTSVVYRGYLYLAGGTNAGGTNESGIYAAKILGDGGLGPLKKVGDLSQVLANQCAVAHNGWLYFIGGSAGFNKVHRAQVAPDGSLASVIVDANAILIPDPSGTSYTNFTAIVIHDTLYVLSAANVNAASTTVQYCKINKDGSLNPFKLGGSMALGRARHASFLYKDKIFSFGGCTGVAASTSTAAIEVMRVSGDGGDPGASSLLVDVTPGEIRNCRGCAIGDWVILVGGADTSNNPKSTVYVARMSQLV